VVPYDEKLIEAERAEAAPLDYAPDAPAIQAIASIARDLSANGGNRASASNGGSDDG
jgi:hypothetical protein